MAKSEPTKEKPATKAPTNDSKQGKAEEPKKEEVEKPVEVVYDPWKELKKNILLLEKAVVKKELNKLNRVLRLNTKIRYSIKKSQLQKAVELYVADDSPNREIILKFVGSLHDEPQEMDVESPATPTTPTTKIPEADDKRPIVFLPEVEIYLHVLASSLLLKEKRNADAATLLSALIDRATVLNKRTLDHFLGKAYALLSLAYEHLGKLSSIRSALLAAHRSACLRHDEVGQATLINLLLRNYLHHNLVDQAFKLVSKTSFPESVSNNQFVRYLYYVGKIQAVQLDYSDSFAKLTQAIRKAPQNTALGFRTALLMGEIPERSTFSQSELKFALEPYHELTQTVRVGSLVDFNNILEKFQDTFKRDKTYTLILRLRHNVIKTGLRKINTSYSKISFKDICEKLGLDSAQNAEFVCAKAIRDGVIDAVIDHDHGWMQSKEFIDVYETTEPQQAFHKRITFCLDVHNEAVKAMRYPPDAYKKELESTEERQEREKTDEEIAKDIEDELDEEGL